MNGIYNDSGNNEKREMRGRATTATTLCSFQNGNFLQPMEIEALDSSHLNSQDYSKNQLYASPSPAMLTKNRLKMLNLDDTFQSINRFHSSAQKKPKKEIEADIFFDLTLKKSQGIHLKGFLSLHDISEKYRAKMMDWMIEVLNLSKQKEDTVFKAFYIMDLYFYKNSTRVSVDQLHLIGSVSMLIASKQEETSPIGLDSLIKTICRDKFTKDQILATEFEILSRIEFKVHFPTIFELSRCAFNFFTIDETEVRDFFQKGTLLIAKMCLFSYEIVSNFDFNEITALSIILSLKLVESFKKGFSSQDKVDLLDI
jgi:hypothetical protein